MATKPSFIAIGTGSGKTASFQSIYTALNSSSTSRYEVLVFGRSNVVPYIGSLMIQQLGNVSINVTSSSESITSATIDSTGVVTVTFAQAWSSLYVLYCG